MASARYGKGGWGDGGKDVPHPLSFPILPPLLQPCLWPIVPVPSHAAPSPAPCLPSSAVPSAIQPASNNAIAHELLHLMIAESYAFNPSNPDG